MSFVPKSGQASTLKKQPSEYDVPPPVIYPQICLERTLALIKPDAIGKAQEIEDIILTSGFLIVQKRKFQLNVEQATDFYAHHYGKMEFPSLVNYMSSAPIIALVLLKNDAISSWLNLIGPTNPLKGRETHPGCLRATYGTDHIRNAVHGSETIDDANRELRYLFPESVIEPIYSGESAEKYLSRKVNPTLFKGLTEICKAKPADPIIWFADWLKANNPNQPHIDHATSKVEK